MLQDNASAYFRKGDATDVDGGEGEEEVVSIVGTSWEGVVAMVPSLDDDEGTVAIVFISSSPPEGVSSCCLASVSPAAGGAASAS